LNGVVFDKIDIFDEIEKIKNIFNFVKRNIFIVFNFYLKKRNIENQKIYIFVFEIQKIEYQKIYIFVFVFEIQKIEYQKIYIFVFENRNIRISENIYFCF